jgi:hypothetical protein
MIGTKFVKKFLRYNICMAKIYIKNDEDSRLVKDFLKKYIRQETVHNLAVHEQNADICISLFIPEYPAEEKFNAYFYNNTENMQELADKIYYQCSKAEIKTRPVAKRSIPRDQYEIDFKCPTLGINLTNDSKEIDDEIYALVIGQGIVSYFSPGTVFDTFSVKDKIKKPGDKSFTNKKYIQESTNNYKILFKK